MAVAVMAFAFADLLFLRSFFSERIA